MNSDILYFIGLFKDAEYIFMNGLCYWFAHILYYRFREECDCEIYYEPIVNHFVTKINGLLYDANGIVNEDGLKFESWEQYKVTAGDMHLLIPNCIKKLPYKDKHDRGEL